MSKKNLFFHILNDDYKGHTFCTFVVIIKIHLKKHTWKGNISIRDVNHLHTRMQLTLFALSKFQEMALQVSKAFPMYTETTNTLNSSHGEEFQCFLRWYLYQQKNNIWKQTCNPPLSSNAYNMFLYVHQQFMETIPIMWCSISKQLNF